MRMKRLEKLLEKEILTFEELETIEQSQEVANVEDCGMSGYKVGCHLWNVTLSNGDEYEVYTK